MSEYVECQFTEDGRKRHISLETVLPARVSRAVLPIRKGFAFYGPAADVVYEACTDPRFWGTTGVRFSLRGEGKKIYCAYKPGRGSGRAETGGNETSLDPFWQGRPLEKHLWAHEMGHICWLGHNLIPEDLMSNPVSLGHFTTENDRRRFVQAYLAHGGRLRRV